MFWVHACVLQVRDLQARLAQQQQQQQPSQDSHAAMQAAHQALQARVADLESENRQLKQRSTEMVSLHTSTAVHVT